MVGGKVEETIKLEDKVWVNCRGTGIERKETCAVYVERNADAEAIKPGDSFWWQGGNAYWTPADRSRVEVKIERRSYSGVNRPEGY